MAQEMAHDLGRKVLLLTIAILLTSCTTQRITCWNEKTGQITYIGPFDGENKVNYIVDVADGVRDFHSKQSCQLHENV